MRNTHIRNVKGFAIIGQDKLFPIPTTVTVRWTKDKLGSTLSLSVDDKIMIGIPYEAIRDMVEDKHVSR